MEGVDAWLLDDVELPEERCERDGLLDRLRVYAELEDPVRVGVDVLDEDAFCEPVVVRDIDLVIDLVCEELEETRWLPVPLRVELFVDEEEDVLVWLPDDVALLEERCVDVGLRDELRVGAELGDPVRVPVRVGVRVPLRVRDRVTDGVGMFDEERDVDGEGSAQGVMMIRRMVCVA